MNSGIAYPAAVATVLAAVVGTRLLVLTRVPYFREFFRAGPWGDAVTYLYLTQFFREHRCGVPDARSLITSEPVYYPALFMKLAGRIFSDKLIFRRSWLPNFLLFALFTSLFTLFLCGHYAQGQWSDVAFVLLFFAVQADNVVFDTHRAHFIAFQPRYLNVGANGFFWLVYAFTGPLDYWALKIFLLFVCINTSIFGRQSIVFVGAIVSALMLDQYLLGYFLAACVASAVAFPTEFVPSVKMQVEYAVWYFKTYYRPRRTPGLAYALKLVFSRPMLQSFLYLEFLAAAAYLLVRHDELASLLDATTVQRIAAIYVAVGCVFVLTGLRKFASLGECWRYITFNLYFLGPFVVNEIANALRFSATAKLAAIAVLLGYHALVFKFARKEHNGNDSLLELLERHADALRHSVWFAVPYRLSTLAVVKGIGRQTFEFQYGQLDQHTMAAYFAQYPYLHASKDFMRAHGVTHVLVDKRALLSLHENSRLNLHDPSFHLLDESDQYAVYSFVSCESIADVPSAHAKVQGPALHAGAP